MGCMKSLIERNPARRRNLRRALTLIELVVVLAILVALAGAVLGAIPALLRQTSAATVGAGAAQVDAAMQYFRTTKSHYPDGYDSLLEAPYTLLKSLPKGSLRQLKPKDLDNADRPLLAAAGIRTTWMHDTNSGADGVTFHPLTTTKSFDSTARGQPSGPYIERVCRFVLCRNCCGAGYPNGNGDVAD